MEFTGDELLLQYSTSPYTHKTNILFIKFKHIMAKATIQKAGLRRRGHGPSDDTVKQLIQVNHSSNKYSILIGQEEVSKIQDCAYYLSNCCRNILLLKQCLQQINVLGSAC